MADLFARLAERALGVAAVARPATQPVFAPTRPVAVEALTPAPWAIPHGRDRRPEPEAAVRIPGAERVVADRAPAANDSPLQVIPVPAETRVAIERSEPPTAIPARVVERIEAEIPFEAKGQESREREQRTVEQPTMEQPTGAAAESRSETVAWPFRRPVEPIGTSGTEVRRASQNAGRPAAPDARVRAGVPQPAAPPFPPAAAAAAQTARTQDKETVQNYGQADSRVEVRIGRIEVRAVFPEPPPLSPVGRTEDSALSLADYLKERDSGVR